MPVDKYFLRTERLGFRRWSEDDLGIATTQWGDPEVTRFLVDGGRLSAEGIRKRLEREIACHREHGIQYWPMFLLETDEHIGCSGLCPYDLDKNILETGFQVLPCHWRQGFAEEASRAVIRHAFDSLKVTALFAGHNPNNEAPRCLLSKLGFELTHEEFYEPTGLMYPSYLLTEETYRSW
ncbi:MAG: GNAT family N-acetyltransferase [Limisphaerales bacterium]